MDCSKPVIAAVNGAAFAGGLGLVGAADIAVSVADAKFSFSEVRIGVIPAVISVVCLPKLGTHHAMKLFLTGERFSGSDAVRMGFVHRAVPADELRRAVLEEIDMIRLGGPEAVKACKNWLGKWGSSLVTRPLNTRVNGAEPCSTQRRGKKVSLRFGRSEHPHGYVMTLSR